MTNKEMSKFSQQMPNPRKHKQEHLLSQKNLFKRHGTNEQIIGFHSLSSSQNQKHN